ncbi:nicotinate-nucleotide--dimethylbenzimidazole phosphoribosyltransferase [Larsenimonas suaedae]|uniref:Nicotinate-nucleotide--dimethylbenzimidazole phosphoribosyltransferase n=1 Tax=Larsenimonas suaedae TaxID=1851019 RepID=A0ABU1GXL8_9GAMM|nr:nicotinate-nucleotide--dimethylbenzimidazole phosphoribosyltransferase [Larsenimonas suaedae]MCM2971535.1 nicotinate-nucleotide--dimethylbenzimidazole phosphoribosyltransferase [Larsenimonas suaedae]MDR5896791.1 nicotinate-nucleotide--dimethylbenzimidazole phosphoribosyltransferase [Larsenimonas suaedae]
MTFNIPPVSTVMDDLIRRRIDSRTKPPGALGELEALAFTLARVLGTPPFQATPPEIRAPRLLIMAGDHGVAEFGVSIAPQAVTRQMVSNFLAGGASVNAFARQADLPVTVVDWGMRTALDDERIIDARLGAGTAAFHQGPAMDRNCVEAGFEHARSLIGRLHHEGTNLIALGEMGIGNTSSASALMAALTGHPVAACVGRGTGVNDIQLARKKALITQALRRHREALFDPIDTLAALGGFELVGLVGAILAGAEAGMAVVIDGFMVSVAAMYACAIAPEAREYLIFSHQSEERGHALALDWLAARPLLSLGLRIGEGSGAALALPMLRSALAFYNEMASFDDAGVTV